MVVRHINFFEKILLPVGLILTFFGFYLIIQADTINTMIGWLRIISLFLWMILLFTVIQSATTEDMKEELAMIQKEHVTEIKILREIVHDQLQEMKLLRDDLKKSKK